MIGWGEGRRPKPQSMEGRWLSTPQSKTEGK